MGSARTATGLRVVRCTTKFSRCMRKGFLREQWPLPQKAAESRFRKFEAAGVNVWFGAFKLAIWKVPECIFG